MMATMVGLSVARLAVQRYPAGPELPTSLTSVPLGYDYFTY